MDCYEYLEYMNKIPNILALSMLNMHVTKMQRGKNVIDFIDNKMKLSLTSILNINLGSDPYISNIQCFVVRTMSNMKKIKRNRSNHAINWNKGAIKNSYCRHFTRIQITFLTAHFPIYHVGMYAYSCAKRKCDLFFFVSFDQFI